MELGERRSVSRLRRFFGGLFAQLALGLDPVAHFVSRQSEIPAMFGDVVSAKTRSHPRRSPGSLFRHRQCGEAWVCFGTPTPQGWDCRDGGIQVREGFCG